MFVKMQIMMNKTQINIKQHNKHERSNWDHSHRIKVRPTIAPQNILYITRFCKIFINL